MPAPPATPVAVLAYPGISPLHLAVPCAVFGEYRPDAGLPPARLRVCALRPGPLPTSAGFGLDVRHSLRALRGARVVVVPGWPPELPEAEPALLEALRRAHREGALVLGLCLGAFVLAQAGLLDGRRAATHWLRAAELAARHPAVRVDADVLYVDGGDVVTSAGSAAALDCCLHVYRRLHGAQAAARLARRLVVPPHRQGGQAQYIEQPLPAALEPDAFSQALDWALRHLDQPHSLDSLARRARLSRRHFTRRFRAAMGASVGAWLLGQRLARAQRLLEGSRRGVEQVAQDSGFGSAVSLRQHFQRAFRTSPAAYRREFGGR